MTFECSLRESLQTFNNSLFDPYFRKKKPTAGTETFVEQTLSTFAFFLDYLFSLRCQVPPEFNEHRLTN